jgi:hypothetical protein
MAKMLQRQLFGCKTCQGDFLWVKDINLKKLRRQEFQSITVKLKIFSLILPNKWFFVNDMAFNSFKF